MQSVSNNDDLPAVMQIYDLPEYPLEAESPRAGMRCPFCHEGMLDYDGVLDLVCQVCGYKSSGGAGCT
jgi:uncharacterized protein (DUF983 family)